MSKDIKKVRRKKKLSGYEKGAKLTNSAKNNSLYDELNDIYYYENKHTKPTSYIAYRIEYVKDENTPIGETRLNKIVYFVYTIGKDGRFEIVKNGNRLKLHVKSEYEKLEWNSTKYNKDKLPFEPTSLMKIRYGENVKDSMIKIAITNGNFYSKHNLNAPLKQDHLGRTEIHGKLIDGWKYYKTAQMFSNSKGRFCDWEGEGEFKKEIVPDFRRVLTRVHDDKMLKSKGITPEHNRDEKVSNLNSLLMSRKLTHLLNSPITLVKLEIGKRKKKRLDKYKKVVWEPYPVYNSDLMLVMNNGDYELYYGKEGIKCLKSSEKYDSWYIEVDYYETLSDVKDDFDFCLFENHGGIVAKPNRKDTIKQLRKESEVRNSRVRFTRYVEVTLFELQNEKLNRYTNKIREKGIRRMKTGKDLRHVRFIEIYNIGHKKIMCGKDDICKIDSTFHAFSVDTGKNEEGIIEELWVDKDNFTVLDGKLINIDILYEQEYNNFKTKIGSKQFKNIFSDAIKCLEEVPHYMVKDVFKYLYIVEDGYIYDVRGHKISLRVESGQTDPHYNLGNLSIYGPLLTLHMLNKTTPEKTTYCFTEDFKSRYRNGLVKEITDKDYTVAHKNVSCLTTIFKPALNEHISLNLEQIGLLDKNDMIGVDEDILALDKRYVVFNINTGKILEPDEIIPIEYEDDIEGADNGIEDIIYKERVWLKKEKRKITIIFQLKYLITKCKT